MSRATRATRSRDVVVMIVIVYTRGSRRLLSELRLESVVRKRLRREGNLRGLIDRHRRRVNAAQNGESTHQVHSRRVLRHECGGRLSSTGPGAATGVPGQFSLVRKLRAR